MMENVASQRPQRNRLGTFIALIVVIAIGVWGGLNYPSLSDYVLARTVATPTPQVAAIANELALTPTGRNIFYVSEPKLEDSAKTFPCKSGETNSVILGCFGVSSAWIDKGQIYLLDVKSSVLEGVVQVTAAHEMLHAAYHRLNFLERGHIDSLVRAQYAKLQNDPILKEQMEYYHTNEPGQDVNELHSILGTTVEKLDPELEEYYSRYFTDRSKVVSYYQQYFTALHHNDEKIAALKTKLETEATALSVDTARYETDLSQLNADIASFNSRANSGGFSSQSAFTAARVALMARVATMNVRSESLNARVAAYNADVKEINELSAQTEELYSNLKGVATPGTVES